MKRKKMLLAASLAVGCAIFLVILATNGSVSLSLLGGAIGGGVALALILLIATKGKESNATLPEKPAQALSDPTANPTKKPAQSWRLVEKRERKLRQIVIEIAETNWTPSRFASLVLGTKFVSLICNNWVAGFFRLESEPGPFLLIRTDGFVERLKEATLHIGFSFFRTRHGGVFVLYVEPARPIPGSPYAFIEIVYGLDLEDNKQRLSDAFQKETLDIVLADRSDFEYRFADTSGIHYAPLAKFDLQAKLSTDLRNSLLKELEELIDWHNTIPLSQKNHNAAAQEVWSLMPLEKSPLMKET